MRLSLAWVILALSPILTAQVAPAASTTDDARAALERVKELKMLKPGQTYSLPAGGSVLTGTNDDFLRRRGAEEIMGSGLSSGSGDHSTAFYSLMRAKGAELLFVDSVELSIVSLLNKLNGHSGVAVKDSVSGRWILMDPANGRILARNWDSASKIYTGPRGRFWIAYSGRLEDYPLKTPEALRSFYETALKAVPATVWEEELVRLDFSASSVSNPNTPAFMKRYSSVYEKAGVSPKKTAKIELVEGGPGPSKDCSRTGADSWTCPVGQSSGMTQSWFAWIERQVSRQIREPF